MIITRTIRQLLDLLPWRSTVNRRLGELQYKLDTFHAAVCKEKFDAEQRKASGEALNGLDEVALDICIDRVNNLEKCSEALADALEEAKPGKRLIIPRPDIEAEVDQMIEEATEAVEQAQEPVVVSAMEETGTIRRNGPCPCGSGRKFKSCCRDEVRFGDLQKLKSKPRPKPKSPTLSKKARAEAIKRKAKRKRKMNP